MNTKLVPHIVVFRQLQYLVPEFFYKWEHYHLLKHYSLYALVIFCFVAFLVPQIITKNVQRLVIIGIVIEVLRVFDFIYIDWIFLGSILIYGLWKHLYLRSSVKF